MTSLLGNSRHDLTPAQSVALGHVALLAEECAHPRFAVRQALGSVVLTVNAGYE